MDSKIAQLQQMVSNSTNIVLFGGAGVSTESGIPDFRSADGLYRQNYKYPPEEIISHDFFIENTKDFYDFYRSKMIFLSAKPNAAHIWLANREKSGRVKGVITQNIDGLHWAAGSKNVLELHGSIYDNYCMSCGKKYSVDYILNRKSVPRCSCGGTVRPGITLYQEIPDQDTMEQAIELIKNARTLIVAGTSLNVYPAAGLIRFFGGEDIVLINREQNRLENIATLAIYGSVGEVLSQIDYR